MLRRLEVSGHSRKGSNPPPVGYRAKVYKGKVMNKKYAVIVNQTITKQRVTYVNADNADDAHDFAIERAKHWGGFCGKIISNDFDVQKTTEI